MLGARYCVDEEKGNSAMMSFLRLLSELTERVVSRALYDDGMPMVYAQLLTGPIWDDMHEVDKRQLPVAISAVPYWWGWLHSQGQELVMQDYSFQNIVRQMVSRPEIIERLRRSPISAPAAPLAPQEPSEPLERWIFSVFVRPLLLRVLWPPRPKEQIRIPSVLESLANLYEAWEANCDNRYQIAPLIGFVAPRSTRIELDNDVVVRPITDGEVQALLTCLPVAHWFVLFMPHELGQVRHVIEYYPRSQAMLDRDSYSYGITRALTAFRLAFGHQFTTPWYATMLEHPLPTFAGSASIQRRTPGVYGVATTGEFVNDDVSHNLVKKIYSTLGEEQSDTHERLQLALRWYDTALDSSDTPDRLIASWIGLEALYGDGQGELSFRIPLRAATYLSQDADSGDFTSAFAMLRKSYDARSRVVHGGKFKSRAALDELAQESLNALRKTLQAAMLRSEPWPEPKVLDENLLILLQKSIQLYKRSLVESPPRPGG